MTISEEQYELAERYLAGLLSEKELTDFEKMLAENPALKDQTEKIRRVNELMFMEGLKTEIPTIQKAQQQYLFRQQMKQYGKWLGGFLILAAVVSVVWMYARKEKESAVAQVVSEKRTNTDDSVIAIVKPETKEIVQPFSSNSSPVVASKEPVQNIVLPEDHKTAPEEKNIPSSPDQEYIVNGKIIPKEKVDPCNITITGTFETTATCENKNEGSIRLTSVAGGRKPYLLGLDREKLRKTTVFQFLSEGEYEVTIVDADGCDSKSVVSVPVKSCAVTSKDYVFSYQNTQEFTFPDLSENDLSFHVYNRAAGLEYSVEINNGIPSSWNGYGSNGQKLPIGSYSFRFISSDNKVLQQGTITIVD